MKKLLIIPFLISMLGLKAQTACDSLEIEVYYSPFTDTLIEVHVINNSSELFSYPGFVIIDVNGDTVAKEEVNFFGIAAESVHSLQIYQGALTSPNFAGQLQLWSGFYSTLECTYNMQFDLCPDSCIKFYPYLINTGGAISSGTVNWTLQDTTGFIIASGSLTLDNFNQDDRDTVCLLPGNYTLNVSANPTPFMGQPFFGITSQPYYSNGPQMFYSGNAASLPFAIFENCVLTSVIEKDGSDAGLHMLFNNGILEILNTGIGNKWNISVYSTAGQLMWKGETNSGKKTIDLNFLVEGIYLAEARNGERVKTLKIIVVR